MSSKRRPREQRAPVTGCRLFLRVLDGERRVLGPGRAALLEQIDRTGSISAAARQMGMSYRRAWLLVQDLSERVGEAVVETAQGGRRGGGALLSERGRALLHLYRRIERAAESAVADDLARLDRVLEKRATTPSRAGRS